MNYEKTAASILELAGGKANISAVTHCVTRLRLTPKDRGLVDDEAIKKLDGVIGTKNVGTQYQVIIGQNVEYVYKNFCKQAGMEETAIVEASENDEKPKEKMTIKKVVGSVVDAIGACVTPMLPIITAAGNHQADCISSWTKHVECASGNQRIHETSGTGWRCRFLFLPGLCGIFRSKEIWCKYSDGIVYCRYSVASKSD